METDAKGYAVKGHRPSSARRNFLAQWLWEKALNACTVCGEDTRLDVAAGSANRAVLMHVVPSGPKRMGWTAGNVFSGCEACNSADGGRDLTPYVHLFAGIIPATWMPGEAYERTTRGDAAGFAYRAERRKALGLPY